VYSTARVQQNWFISGDCFIQTSLRQFADISFFFLDKIIMLSLAQIP